VGRQVDVAGLGPLPPNARVVNWWPQAEALAEAAIVLGHGGFGTTMGAVVAGVPQVVCPLFSTDQVVNARHVASAGAGRRVEPGPDVVTRACRELPVLLSGDEYRASAQQLALDAAALPPEAAAVATLEQLAR
jgi:UDP:flavonoid glycosyltransferase YjiC (YdhE family)